MVNLHPTVPFFLSCKVCTGSVLVTTHLHEACLAVCRAVVATVSDIILKHDLMPLHCPVVREALVCAGRSLLVIDTSHGSGCACQSVVRFLCCEGTVVEDNRIFHLTATIGRRLKHGVDVSAVFLSLAVHVLRAVYGIFALPCVRPCVVIEVDVNHLLVSRAVAPLFHDAVGVVCPVCLQCLRACHIRYKQRCHCCDDLFEIDSHVWLVLVLFL